MMKLVLSLGNSFFQKNTNKIVLKFGSQIDRSNKESIKTKMESIKEARWAKQPKDFPNAGSVLKDPKVFMLVP